MQLQLCLALLAASSAYAQSSFECPDEFEGYYPHDTSCDKYWECREGVATLELCGNGLAFDDRDPTYTTKNCAYLHDVNCDARPDLEPPISAPNCPRLYGNFHDPDDCAGFFQCRDGLSNRFSCAPGLAYDLENRVCQWRDKVQRCKDEKTEEEEGAFVCPDNVPVGIFSKHAHPEDCRQYYVCIAGTPREYGCPLGTVFAIGNDEFDGKCTDPEEVPECANYYGDLQFDKEELVRAGVDPEAVGVSVDTSERVRVNRPQFRNTQRKPAPAPAVVEEEEEEEVLRPAPRPASRTNSNSFRARPSRPRGREPAAPPPPPPAPTPSRSTFNSIPVSRQKPSSARPAPSRPAPSRPAPSRPAPTRPAAPAREEEPTFSIRTALPSVPSSPAVPAIPLVTLTDRDKSPNLGEPVKVKAGEDYYYYYYYDYPEDDDETAKSA